MKIEINSNAEPVTEALRDLIHDALHADSQENACAWTEEEAQAELLMPNEETGDIRIRIAGRLFELTLKEIV